MRSDFAVFILTHGRANNVKTLKTLERHGYKGKVYLICDDEDAQLDDYLSKYGDMVIVFDKKHQATLTDNADNFEKRTTITHARNFSFQAAKQLGVKYFIQLDDDYRTFEWRFKKGQSVSSRQIKDIERVFEAMLEFYIANPQILSLAMAQAGDLIGGIDGARWQPQLMRKCMNSFICSTDRPITFLGTMNEDVNTYVTLGMRGGLFFTCTCATLTQTITQSNEGGITELYLDAGTYTKAMYTVMHNPSAVSVQLMGWKNMRLHHKINWRCAVPKIIPQSTK